MSYVQLYSLLLSARHRYLLLVTKVSKDFYEILIKKSERRKEIGKMKSGYKTGLEHVLLWRLSPKIRFLPVYGTVILVHKLLRRHAS